MKVSGNLLKRGVQVPSLKRELKWEFVQLAKLGDMLNREILLEQLKETAVVTQKIMVPYGIKGEI